MPKYMGGLGFRDFEIFNLALLAKQAWRILDSPESLSSKILKAAYFPNSNFSEAEVGTHPFQIWRSLLDGRDILKQCLIRRIGNGVTTDIWQMNWIPRPENMRPIVSLVVDPPRLVSELMIGSEARWNSELIGQVFLPYDAASIMQIPICTHNIEDFWSWNFEKFGWFSVRLAYRMVMETKQRREDWLEE